MRIDNSKHLPWFIFVLLATIAAGVLYLGNFHPASLPFGLRLPAGLIQKPTEHHTVGGTPLGLWFGTISLAIFVFAALLSLRKKIPLWRLGTVQRWLRAHIWLTFLTVPLVLFHSGFHFGGPMTTLLMVLYIIVMVSGVYGLFLQHVMPRLMKEELPAESVFQQIPHIRARLVAAAEKMRDSFLPEPVTNPAAPIPDTSPAAPAEAASQAVLAEFITSEILPYLRARRVNRMRLNRPRFSEDTFRFVKLRVTEDHRADVEQIQAWCNERRLIDRQVRLQHWLHAWLFIHVPFSFLLLLLTIWHAVATLFYY